LQGEADWTLLFGTDRERASDLDMLELYAVLQLRPATVSQQDFALPHHSYSVRNHLNRKMPGRWIGTDAPIACPPLSPDFNHLRFSLWIYVTGLVYAVKNDIQQLKARCSKLWLQ
jgi:hypothetical protein